MLWAFGWPGKAQSYGRPSIRGLRKSGGLWGNGIGQTRRAFYLCPNTLHLPTGTGMKYKRILLKLSGEALMGAQGYGIDPAIVQSIATDVAAVVATGTQLAIVVGGGNIFRDRKSTRLNSSHRT